MRIYIAGPMTGYDSYNFPAFDAARDQVRALGHIPVSPADLDRAIGFDPADPRAVRDIRIDKDFTRSAIIRDVNAILDCDALVVLPGWEKSRGANGEVGVAKWLGLTIYQGVESIPQADDANTVAA